jgi:hypothetical protein
MYQSPYRTKQSLTPPPDLTSILTIDAGPFLFGRAAAITAKPASAFWKPQPKQEELLKACGLSDALSGGRVHKAQVERIGYGGAAFGGKTEGLVAIGLIAALRIPGVRIGYFRRTFTELEGSDGPIERSRSLYTQTGGRYNSQEHVWRWGDDETGAALHFCHCHAEQDVYRYQSQAFDILLIDEAEHFTWFIVDYLLTRNRVSKYSKIPRPFSVMTANPGGVGHVWYKAYFEPPIGGKKELANPNGATEKVLFIPALLEDNPIGTTKDPGYEARLLARDPKVARALRYADWNIFAGQALAITPQHVMDPFEIPHHWPVWIGLDWGYHAPFACVWLTKDPDNGRHYVIQELYQAELTDRQQARAIKEWSKWPTQMRYADPSIWASKNVNGVVTSTADEYSNEGVTLVKADNDRLNGKRKIDRLLMDLPDGKPGLMFFSNCKNVNRTMAALPYARTGSTEDVDTDAEDHAYDAVRYGLTRTDTAPKKPKDNRPLPIQGLVGRRT